MWAERWAGAAPPTASTVIPAAAAARARRALRGA